MSKQSLLLVDGDTRSLRVLEVSLRKAGFTVTTSESVRDALEKLEVHQPDLIVSETAFTDGDGFELRRRVRATPEWGDIPFIFLTAEQAIENKIRGLELGVDDYLTKPIYIKEIITRINILLQKRQRARFEERRDGRTRFAGRVSDMPVVDVIQTIEISRKSGVIQFLGERNKQATIYFRDGRVIDAEAGSLQGEDAVYRLLTWSDGEFEVVFRTVRRREVIQTSSQGLLMEGMRRLDEWSRILEQLPPLAHRFEVDAGELAARLGEVPDDNNRILRLIDGKRTALEVIDASDVGDLECLQAIARLYFEEILIDLDWATGEKRRTTDRQMLVEMPNDPPTPIEDAASGPNAQQRRETSGPRLMPSAPAANSATPGAGSGPTATPGFLDADQGATTDPVPAVAEASTETQPTDAADVISEEDVPLTPLMGGFRPSSLRLIDEAVAAAQAIEPSLFAGMDDLDDAPLEPSVPLPSLASQVARLATPSVLAATLPAIPPVSIGRAPTSPPVVVIPPVAVPSASAPTPDAGVPQAIESDEPSSPQSARTRRQAIESDESSSPQSARTRSGRLPAQVVVVRAPTVTDVSGPLGRDDSGLRMIGSLGRDRAEASGELRPSQLMGAVAPPPETARELVTILPRRSTREIPIQVPPAGVTVDADGVVTSTATTGRSAAMVGAAGGSTSAAGNAGADANTTLRGVGVGGASSGSGGVSPASNASRTEASDANRTGSSGAGAIGAGALGASGAAGASSGAGATGGSSGAGTTGGAGAIGAGVAGASSGASATGGSSGAGAIGGAGGGVAGASGATGASSGAGATGGSSGAGASGGAGVGGALGASGAAGASSGAGANGGSSGPGASGGAGGAGGASSGAGANGGSSGPGASGGAGGAGGASSGAGANGGSSGSVASGGAGAGGALGASGAGGASGGAGAGGAAVASGGAGASGAARTSPVASGSSDGGSSGAGTSGAARTAAIAGGAGGSVASGATAASGAGASGVASDAGASGGAGASGSGPHAGADRGDTNAAASTTGSGPRAASTGPGANAMAGAAVDPAAVAAERRELDSRRNRRADERAGGTSVRGVGAGTIALIAVAIVLAAIAVVLKVRKHPAAGPTDAAPTTPGNLVGAPVEDASPRVAPDAAVALASPDASPAFDAAVAATTVHDAALAPAPADAAPAPVDPQLEAKTLYAQAYSALEEHDDAKALALAQQSLKLRRTARTFLLEASALQHLGKIDDSIDSIDAAIDIYKRNGSDNAAAWEQKGRVLWGSNRKDEARVAFNHYLELDPDGPHAKQIHRLIDEP